MIDLNEKSPEELQRLIFEAQLQLQAKQQQQRKEVIAKIKELAASIGVAVEILDAKDAPPLAVLAKYRNPSNYLETWSGRGLAPKWLQALIAQGHDKSEFLIS